MALSTLKKANPQTTKKTKIAIIGTGFSGLGMAIKLKESGENDFVVLEKEAEVGGTWLVNQYPGCACDVQSHLYSFSFEQNPNWSRMFAPQPEILGYLKDCADKYNVREHIRFNTELRAAQYNEETAEWTLELADGQTLVAQIVISGMGGLSRPSYPEIPGIESFTGKTFHSQQWDYDYDLTGKRVAVIGTGASAIQFVPQIAPQVKQLDLYQRTAPWVMHKPDRAIRATEQILFKRFPKTQTAVRGAIYSFMESRAVAFTLNPRLMKVGERWAKSHIRKQINDPVLRDKVTPDYTIGCKRILISNDYYPALNRSNVDVLTTGIKEVRGNTIISQDGSEREVDAIIYGTGFAATDPIGPLKITGREGVDLKEQFKRNGTEAYLGATVVGFPNLFLITGPNTGLGHNSMVYMIESQITYIMDALGHIRRKKLASVEVSEWVQDNFNKKLQSKQKDTVWSTGGCQSWYLDENGKNVTLWPGFTWQFRRQTSRFEIRDYHIQHKPRARRTRLAKAA